MAHPATRPHHPPTLTATLVTSRIYTLEAKGTGRMKDVTATLTEGVALARGHAFLFL